MQRHLPQPVQKSDLIDAGTLFLEERAGRQKEHDSAQQPEAEGEGGKAVVDILENILHANSV